MPEQRQHRVDQYSAPKLGSTGGLARQNGNRATPHRFTAKLTASRLNKKKVRARMLDVLRYFVD